jgi:hypothetical protein
MISGSAKHFRQGLALMATLCLPVRRQQDVFLLQQRVLQASADNSNAASVWPAVGVRKARHMSKRSSIALRQFIPWLALTFKMKIPFP